MVGSGGDFSFPFKFSFQNAGSLANLDVIPQRPAPRFSGSRKRASAARWCLLPWPGS